ncbi:MAG: type I-G CRISPR-associated helicase/endonuclease Cas3g [Acidimicrobiales bacterium]
MDDFPSFAEFYRALNDRDPFPWQERLAAAVAKNGWPTDIGVGTGMGKTSCLDIAVWAMAWEGGLKPSSRVMPTRVWYVVNRRLLVDAAWEHGRLLREELASPSNKAIKAVADGLMLRQGEVQGEDLLHVYRLRGGADLGVRPPTPAQPSLIFATIPMFASRWMFRGFGTSAKMRPVDAAIAGTDSLVLLDEAHLARPLSALTDPVQKCDVGDPATVLPSPRSRPIMVCLTATGDNASCFTLDEDDEENATIQRRLDARKPIKLVKTPKTKLHKELADQLVALLEDRPPSASIVFANSPRTARLVFEELGKRRDQKRDPLVVDLHLLTGRMRDREAKAQIDAVLDPVSGARAGRDRSTPRRKHLVVVATQTLEVGADLDFDLLVTEACGARALIQRLGRLNRLGDVNDSRGALVLAEKEEVFGIYGSEPLNVWKRLENVAHDGEVDLGPRHVIDRVGTPDDVPQRTGELLPAHLWEWAKTTNAPSGEAPPELFYDGFDDQRRTVSIVWRAVIPEADNLELRPSVLASEAVDVPIGEAREVIVSLSEEQKVFRLTSDRVSVESVLATRVRPGDVLIFPVTSGKYDDYGWSPDAEGPLLDVSLFHARGIPLDSIVLEQISGDSEYRSRAQEIVKELAEPPETDGERDDDALAKELVQQIRLAPKSDLISEEEWCGLVGRLSAKVSYDPKCPTGSLVLEPRKQHLERSELRSDVFDELSFTASASTLTGHLGSVGELAEKIASSIGLPDHLVRAAGLAGRFHDHGKADARCQRWFDPDSKSDVPVAKSATPRDRWERDRVMAGWPRGGRHEELSRRLLLAYLEKHPEETWDVDLVVHLVISHHGYGRPLLRGVPDKAPPWVTGRVEGMEVTVSGDLSEVDWDQPARFRRLCERYGYWGLALMESIVRQADHQVSSVVVP